jgi:hypothetical protein
MALRGKGTQADKIESGFEYLGSLSFTMLMHRPAGNDK